MRSPHPTKHETKQCPRCGAAFECKVNNPVHCQCAGITLPEPVLDRLSAAYDDCLCAACLRALATGAAPLPGLPALPAAVEPPTAAARNPDPAAPSADAPAETPPTA